MLVSSSAPLTATRSGTPPPNADTFVASAGIGIVRPVKYVRPVAVSGTTFVAATSTETRIARSAGRTS